jgi:hypothetical protein
MNYIKVKDREEILGALARGYCHPANKDKVFDHDLINAMHKEIIKTLNNVGWVKRTTK